jgi:hypothetical protein
MSTRLNEMATLFCGTRLYARMVHMTDKAPEKPATNSIWPDGEVTAELLRNVRGGQSVAVEELVAAHDPVAT